MSQVGVVVIGHGETATGLLAAAKAIVPTGALDDVIAVNAGLGETPALIETMCAALDEVDAGAGVLLLVDLLGASPCQCGRREGSDHEVVTLAGLNLAMLLKLSTTDREGAKPQEVALACADSAQRAVRIAETEGKPQS